MDLSVAIVTVSHPFMLAQLLTNLLPLSLSIYKAITRPKIPTTPRRLTPNASLHLATPFEVAVAAAAEFAAVLPVVAVALDADSPVVALAAVVDAADLIFSPAFDVALIAPDSTALAACARPPNPE